MLLQHRPSFVLFRKRELLVSRVLCHKLIGLRIDFLVLEEPVFDGQPEAVYCIFVFTFDLLCEGLFYRLGGIL